jgi:hypothetical protein
MIFKSNFIIQRLFILDADFDIWIKGILIFFRKKGAFALIFIIFRSLHIYFINKYNVNTLHF